MLDDNTIHRWELVAESTREVGGVKKEGVVSLREVDSYSLPGRPGIESSRYQKCEVTHQHNVCPSLPIVLTHPSVMQRHPGDCPPLAKVM